jgi:FixJ family two-component response regulator
MKRTLPDVPSCLVLDIRLPGLGGLEFQKELADAGKHIPIVFMTGDGDIPMAVKAVNAGAIDFLTKPFHEVEMLGAVKKALEIDCVRRREGRNASEPALDLRDEVC